MLSLKSQISILDNFVIREESITPVLAMNAIGNKDANESHHVANDNPSKEVRNF
jgi:hypothetical protein